MKTKTKNKIWTILKIIWFTMGGLVLFWTGYFFIAIQFNKDFGSVIYALLFGIGLIAIFSYIGVSLLALLAQVLIKKFKVKKISSKAQFTEKNGQ